MTHYQKLFVLLLRLAMGWFFFYAGITKVLDPEWSSAGFLSGAKTFPELYSWFAGPEILPITDFLNEWGILLIGISLIVGLFTRAGAIAGVVLMILYYFPFLEFPYVQPYGFLVDDHIIYALALLLLAAMNAGKYWGLDSKR